jgi:Domain of unknown function (DUF4062)
MSFDCDAFISYSHIDNVGLAHGSEGWVTNLHRALEIRVAQLLGKQPQIWRDPKLTGNDMFADTLVAQLAHVAVLITIVSPRYVRSEWTRRELIEFWKAAEAQGGVRLHDKARIFKVLKTPIPREMDPPELQPLLGYEFFKVDPNTGRTRELEEVFGEQAQRDFWLRLDDLAHDIAALLEMLGGDLTLQVGEATGKEGVFVAETTSDLREQRETIRRDLQQHGYRVFPAAGLPLSAPEMKVMLQEELAQCRMSIHLVGMNYGMVPEGSELSLVEIQNELAIERSKQGDFVRLLWMPNGLKVEDKRQAGVIERFKMDPRLGAEADLLETYLEDFKSVIYDRLKTKPKAPEEVREPCADKCKGLVYLIYDPRDANAAKGYEDDLFRRGFDVVRPTFEGDEADVRRDHEENLRVCDGVLILFGSANENWVRRKLREVQKSVGYGRTSPIGAVAIACVAPQTEEKERFRTHEAQVFRQTDATEHEGPLAYFSRMFP